MNTRENIGTTTSLYKPRYDQSQLSNPYMANQPDKPMNNNHIAFVGTGIPPCPNCQQRVDVFEIREVSGAQIFWGCLLMCTMPVICWLPFCLHRCDDRRLQCRNCQHVYDYSQSPLCPYF